MIWSIIVVIVLVIFLWDRNSRNDVFNKIPGPTGIPLLENTFDFIMDPVRLFYYFRALATNYKEIFKVKLGTKKFVVICNPEDAEILISGTKYNSKGFLYGFLENWLKTGLLLSEGSKWYNRRKILTPAFHFNILKHFNRVFQENSDKLVERLERETEKSQTKISSFITEFALHSICETAMGTKLDEEKTGESKDYKNSIYKLGRYIVYRAQRVWMYPNLIFSWTTLGRKQKNVLDLISSFRNTVIEKRRQSENWKRLLLEENKNTEEDVYTKGKKKLAMLDLLLKAEKEGYIDAEGIGEEVDTFMFEGHDTTATALQMIIMLLANNEDAQEKIVNELKEEIGLNESTSLSDLSKLKYLECCIKEGLRLYPPVHFIQRRVDVPLKLKEYEIPAGTDCTVFIYDLHRRSDQFIEPNKFRPERFLTDANSWHPYSFIPFSAGPRNCIGQKFAMTEMKQALAAILKRFKLKPVTTPEEVVFVTDFILRPNHPIYVKFEKRTESF